VSHLKVKRLYCQKVDIVRTSISTKYTMIVHFGCYIYRRELDKHMRGVYNDVFYIVEENINFYSLIIITSL